MRIMALSWLNRSRPSTSVDDLVARGQYAGAVEVLREELATRQPTAADRLRLADLLVLANRTEEAMPILLGVADEQGRFGFTEKAVEALKRAAELEPGRPDVEQRLAEMGYAPSAPPTAAERLREADRLHQEGLRDEALIILFRLADEQASEGFTDKALETLKRAREIEPGRPDIGRRIATLRRSAPRPRRDASPADSGNDIESGLRREAKAEVEHPEPAPGPAVAPPLSGAPAPEADNPEPPRQPRGPEQHLEPDPPTETIVRPADLPELELVEDHPSCDSHAANEEQDELRPLLTEADLDAQDPEPPRVSRRRELGGSGTDPGSVDAELHAFLLNLGRQTDPAGRSLGVALFAELTRDLLRVVADGLHPCFYAPGDVILAEGDPGDSVFLIASGSVRVLIMGGHGQPFDIRRLEAGDFFGEVALLEKRPRTATVVAATPCQALEMERTALETLLGQRPGSRELLEEARARRARSQEEQAVRSLPPEAADPDRAAGVLQAHLGNPGWSPRVRINLARVMLDAGRRDDALAILASVTHDLACSGHAQKAIRLLKAVETIRRRGFDAIDNSPRRGRRRSARDGGSPPVSRAAQEAAVREWVGMIIRAIDELATGSEPPPPDHSDPDLTIHSPRTLLLAGRLDLNSR